MKEYIKDNEGNLIEIEDLSKAIYQVAMYMQYMHSDAAPAQERFDKLRHAYWRDIFIKLNIIKSKKESA
jgi:hypothetical protein